MTLTVGSLFAGIGGFDLGLERAGMRVIWQVENAEHPQRVLHKHWPHVLCYSDIRDVRGDEVEHVDVLCGGFPCQDISLAGRGQGLEGERSSLWFEFARLVSEIRPRYVIVENVAALRRRGLDRVLSDLAALRYDAEWDCLRASDFGAPHRRDRLWLVAYPERESVRLEPRRCFGPGWASEALSGVNGEERSLADANILSRSTRRARDAEQGARRRNVSGGGRNEDVANTNSSRSPLRQSIGGSPRTEFSSIERGSRESHSWATEPDVGRVAHGISARVDRLTGLGNALVPQIAEWIGRRIIAHEEREGRL